MANSLSTRIDSLALQMVSRDEVAHVAHAMLFPANHHKGELLVAGAAVLFAVMAERSGLDPHDLYSLGRKILTDPSQFHHQANVQMEALRDFACLRANANPII